MDLDYGLHNFPEFLKKKVVKQQIKRLEKNLILEEKLYKAFKELENMNKSLSIYTYDELIEEKEDSISKIKDIESKLKQLENTIKSLSN